MMSSRTAALFSLRAVDSETGRGVPRVTFTTTYESSWITDSNGYVAISTLGIEGETLWFAAAADGYEAKADAFGNRGLHASITSGGSAMLNVERTQIAERLYRQTGFGRYYDSIALGDATLLPSQTVQVNSGVIRSSAPYLMVPCDGSGATRSDSRTPLEISNRLEQRLAYLGQRQAARQQRSTSRLHISIEPSTARISLRQWRQ
jgi:hypothetical protein